MKALADNGNLALEDDDSGKLRFVSLQFRQETLVENIRKIANLWELIRKWKSAAFIVNDDPLAGMDVFCFFQTVNDIADCWRKKARLATEATNPCRSCALGCEQLAFSPKKAFPGLTRERSSWYAVGTFDGKAVILDKEALTRQLDCHLNEPLVLCPHFDRREVVNRIANLPEKLDPEADPARWTTAYDVSTRKPAWVLPRKLSPIPFSLTFDATPAPSRAHPLLAGLLPSVTVQPPLTQASTRSIPSTRYADVCGQDTAVEAVRDYAELPLTHEDLFRQVGIQPGRGSFSTALPTMARPSWPGPWQEHRVPTSRSSPARNSCRNGPVKPSGRYGRPSSGRRSWRPR
jgi:hypothetical protein